MKKNIFALAIIVMAISSFSACNNKPEYENPQKSLGFMWKVLQNGGSNIQLENSVMYVSSLINNEYSTRGFEVISMQVTYEDSIIYQCFLENTPNNGWMSEKNVENFSKDGIENLRPLTKEEEKYIKIAYDNIVHK